MDKVLIVQAPVGTRRRCGELILAVNHGAGADVTRASTAGRWMVTFPRPGIFTYNIRSERGDMFGNSVSVEKLDAYGRADKVANRVASKMLVTSAQDKPISSRRGQSDTFFLGLYLPPRLRIGRFAADAATVTACVTFDGATGVGGQTKECIEMGFDVDRGHPTVLRFPFVASRDGTLNMYVDIQIDYAGDSVQTAKVHRHEQFPIGEVQTPRQVRATSWLSGHASPMLKAVSTVYAAFLGAIALVAVALLSSRRPAATV